MSATIAFQPHSGAQERFMARTERYQFFGGAAGGGKTAVLLAKWGYQIAVEAERFARGEITKSKAWGVYFRRTIPNLVQAMDRARELFPAMDPAADFNESRHLWVFPSAGDAHFQFAGLEQDKSYYGWKSSQLTFCAFDELTEFSEEAFEYLDTRLRSSDPVLGKMLWMLAASNPEGVGLLWVRKRFIECAPPETVVRRRVQISRGRVVSHDQIFIPAKLSDNPSLDDGEYEASLTNKRKEIRDALLNGDWYVNAGAFFGDIWASTRAGRPWHVCPNHKIPKRATCFRGGDYGYSAPSAIIWWYVDVDGGLTAFHSINVTEHTPEKLAELIKRVEQHYGLWDDENNMSKCMGNPLDTDCFSKDGHPDTIAGTMNRKGCRWKRSIKDRVNNAAQCRQRLSKIIGAPPEADAPWSSMEMRPAARFMERCTSPILTIPVLPADKDNKDEPDTKANDHDYDAFQYSCMARPMTPSATDRDDDDEDEDELDARRRRQRASGGDLGRGKDW